MDAKTQQMFVTVGAGLAKKVLMLQAAGLVSHGMLSSDYTEVFVSLGMAAIGAIWSTWQDFGKAIFYAQMEVIKAKSLAQAEKMRAAGVSPVTVQQIANKSDKMDAADVAKVAATLPAEVQANIAPVIVKLLLAAFVLSAFLAGDPASAQVKLGPVGQKIANDLSGTKSALTGDAGGDLIAALDAKLLPDLQYAFRLATASGNKVTAPCWKAWIDIITVRQDAVKDDQGQPMPAPDPGIITKFEKAVEIRNSLQSDGEFMLKCSPVAAMIKLDFAKFVGLIVSGGAGLAAMGL